MEENKENGFEENKENGWKKRRKWLVEKKKIIGKENDWKMTGRNEDD